jgi:hypothetical protein
MTAVKLSITLWALLAVSAVFVMTLGTDEAWVLNGLRSVLHPDVQHLSSELIVTNGGAFAATHLAIEWLAGSQVWLHRLVSLTCLGLSFALIVSSNAIEGAPASVKWLMLAPLIAIPGAAELGTAALGTSIGLFLMVAAMVVWTSPRASLATRVLGGGLLYGLAAASRFDLVLFGPAVLWIDCLGVKPSGRLEVRRSPSTWALVAIGAGVFFLSHLVMSAPASSTMVESIGAATGLEGWALNYPKLLNHYSTLVSLAPLPLLAVMAAGAFWSTPSPEESTHRRLPRFESLLAATGVVLLAGWLCRAPISHLRYAFPALFCFAALGAIGLQRIAARSFASATGRQRFLCECIGLACVIGAIGTTTRSLAMSDSDYASWEWSDEMPLDYFRGFEARRAQAEVAAFLRDELPPDARLYSHVPYALRYLTQRPVVELECLRKLDPTAPHADRYLVLTPAVGTYLHLNLEAATWIQSNARLAKQIGRYSVYHLPAGGDEDLPNLQLRRTNYEHHPGSNRWFGR